MARSVEIKKLSVVTFLPLPKHGSTNFYDYTLRQPLRSWSGFIFAKIWYGVQDIFRFQNNSYPKFDSEFVRFVGHILCKSAAGFSWE